MKEFPNTFECLSFANLLIKFWDKQTLLNYQVECDSYKIEIMTKKTDEGTVFACVVEGYRNTQMMYQVSNLPFEMKM